MLCQFLLYRKVTQSSISLSLSLSLYIHIPFLILSSIMVYPKRLGIVPCAIQQDLIAYPS